MKLLPAAAAVLLLQAPLSAERGAETRFQSVLVKPGDTLWGIANAYLKDPTRWNVILRYNKLPTSDPTVALPGIVLRVPVAFIKESMLAASLALRIGDVSYRRRETADWSEASLKMQLFRDDALRTAAASRARVAFVNGETLNVDENSMAVLKPRDKNYDLELLRGEIHAGRSRVVTATARITPKTGDTRFSAKVREDMSTVVQVYTGLAAVEGKGKALDVRGGFSTEVGVDRPPAEPVKLPDIPEIRARMSGGDVFAARLPAVASGAAAAGDEAGGLEPAAAAPPGGAVRAPKDLKSAGADFKLLEVGVPVAAYHFQLSRSPDFSGVLIDKFYDADQAVDLASRVSPGVYWVRVAVVDLLGAEGKFSAPRQYRARAEEPTTEPAAPLFEIIRPEDGDRVRLPKYQILGKAAPELAVTINGKKIPKDEDGNFSLQTLLKEGVNSFRISVVDPQGRETVTRRKVIYEP